MVSLRTCVITALIAISPAAWSADMSEQALAEWIASAAPAAQHLRLQKLSGRWTVHQRDWMGAGAPWNEADGEALWRPMLGGRFMQVELATALKGHPYHGIGVLGFHRDTGKYVATWMDDFGTSLLKLEGDWDEASRTLSLAGYLGAYGDPRTRWVMKQIWRDDDHLTVEWWGPAAGGASAKMVELQYSRMVG